MSTGVVVWLTGLPASGKTRFAKLLRADLLEAGHVPAVLDGDLVRAALVPGPGYSATERDQFYETLANLAAMLAGQGLIVLVPASGHRRAYRERARHLAPRFIEVYVSTPLDICVARDPKGLYASASAEAGSSNLPGIGAEYEAPEQPEVVAQGGKDLEAIGRALALLV